MYPIIKFNSVTDLHTSRYAAAAGVYMVGFCTQPSAPKYISAVQLEEIKGWIIGPIIVGEIDGWPLAESYSFDMLEVSDVEVAKKIPPHIPVILRLTLDKPQPFSLAEFDFEFVLLEKSTQLSQADTNLIELLAQKHKLILCCPQAELIFSKFGCVGFALEVSSLEEVGEVLDLFDQ